MLPTRLEIKNFLAYRSPDPIFFEGIHLACLSGANGAGKSSLLDAITWALWGKARDSRSGDELIHQGQEEMQVTVDFWQGDSFYRVMRKRRLGGLRKDGLRGAGTSTLDFFGWDDTRRVFRLINEPSINATQHAINHLLRLDYDTFVHSAFLKQGQADSFTMQAPAKRKEILSDILGLERWAGYEDRSKEHLKAINEELHGIQVHLAEIEKELQEEPALRAKFEIVAEQLQEAEAQERRAYESYLEFASADKELTAKKSEQQGLLFQVDETQKEIRSAEDEIIRYQKLLDGYQQIIDQRETIEAGYAQLEEARRADLALGDTLRVLRDIDARINELEGEIEKHRQDIILKISTSETVIEEESTKADSYDEIEEQKAVVLKEMALLDQNEMRLKTLDAELTAFKTEQATLVATNKTLRGEMDAIVEKLKMLEDTSTALCPLCKQPLDEEHRSHIAEDFRADGKSRGDLYRQHLGRLEELKTLIANHEQEIRIIQSTIQKMMPLRKKLGGLEQQAHDAEKSNRRIAEERIVLEQLQQILTEEQFAEELRLQLDVAVQEREILAYDPHLHDAIRSQINTFTAYQQQVTQLEIALQALPNTQEDIARTEARLHRYQMRLDDLGQKQLVLEQEVTALQTKVEEMQRRKDFWNQKRVTTREIRDHQIALQQRLATIEGLHHIYQHKRQRESELQYEKGIYEELKGAFGKSGIPAMLIDAAIPELEVASNKLLWRMTNGRMAMRFDTQRAKKTGGIAETFDIQIADELGTRDYSLYSGGEAFRINFAIRIAISQLLARRAGAQLRTLFIDEGFGTQDEAGRERLTEAINAIQNDFDLILVITHIDDLRDAFPVRLEVEKLPQGSRVRVV